MASARDRGAGNWISRPDQPLNLLAVILVGIVGSVIGSFIAYVVGRTGGRAVVDRWGKYVLLTHADLDRSEAWFAKRGSVTVVGSKQYVRFYERVGESDQYAAINLDIAAV